VDVDPQLGDPDVFGLRTDSVPFAQTALRELELCTTYAEDPFAAI
jgi:hypothetical protein